MMGQFKENLKAEFNSFIYNQFISRSETRRNLLANVKSLINRQELLNRKLAMKYLPTSSLITVDRDKGHAYLSNGKALFPEVSEIVHEAKKCLYKAQEEEQFRSKSFLSKGLLEYEELQLHSPFLRFALNPTLLEVVAKYLGQIPILKSINVRYSRHNHLPYYKSQLYHCDWNGSSQIKVFVFCSNVEKESGPLTLVDANVSAQIRKKINYNFDAQGSYVPEEIVKNVEDFASQTEIVGNEGTVVFADTNRCFHFGSRVLSPDSFRLITSFKFVTPLCFEFPLNTKKTRSPFRRIESKDLSCTS